MRQKYSAIRYHFQNSVTGGRFLDMLLGEIREAFDSIAPSGIGPSSVDVLCLGLGNPAVDRTSLRQLALLELLIERDTRLSRAHTKLYDPVFRSVSRRFIRELGMQVITVNAEACYSLSPDRYHFVMMPHCAPALINNLLSTNWCEKVLGRIVLFSNGWRQVRSELTASGEPEDLIATELGCICALEPIVAVADRQGKKGTTKYIEEPDFEGMRVQWFPPTSLMRLSADFWSIPAAAPTLGTKSSKFVGLGPSVTPNSHFSADLIDRNKVPCFVDGENEFESEGYS
ncbi:unnamed protein product [Calicophoron daubneyi]|uniref:SRR1-like domain-containing protein n=1 Tax=Calicophoron daubneyi TaxID=300641 RepID=A0AAV2TN69_CALDB